MTEEELYNLNIMTHPDQWALRPLLPLVNKRKKDNIGWLVGILGEIKLGWFIWYEGANIAEPNTPGNLAAIANNRVLMAYQLEDLVKEGWEVDP